MCESFFATIIFGTVALAVFTLVLAFTFIICFSAYNLWRK
jgi:hypothetical protein